MLDALFSYGPLIGTATMIFATVAVMVIGTRHGTLRSWRTLLPATYLGLHAVIGVLLWVGHTFALPRGDVHLVATLLNLVGLVLLVLTILGMDHVARTTRRNLQCAEREAAEYERARRDYESLMRHRIANPLAVVEGGIRTLADHGEHIDAPTRALLLADMVQALDRLELVETVPTARTVEERDLDGVPRLGSFAVA